jgi:hypothetical protein
MKKTDNLIKVFIGGEASSILLKSRLEESGISALIKNDSSSASLGVAALSVDLYIHEADLEKAKPMITEFLKKP